MLALSVELLLNPQRSMTKTDLVLPYHCQMLFPIADRRPSWARPGVGSDQVCESCAWPSMRLPLAQACKSAAMLRLNNGSRQQETNSC